MSGAPSRVLVRALLGVLLVAALLAVAVVWLNLRGEDDATSVANAVNTPTTPALIARGAYLARAGNCASCHTVQGGAAYAGGRAIATPFGKVYAPNLTPDPGTGIGAWSAADFWRAMHNGRSRDGRLLYPAFPYPNYTRVTRDDADALHAYLKSLPPVVQTNRANTLAFPVNLQASLAVWRALYFRPARFEANPAQSAAWNRGAYLVEGLGHCNACHASRNALGATSSALDLAGGLIPVQNWYAPSLSSAAEAGVADWELPHIVELLGSGVSPRAAVSGPMSEVVGGGTQYLSPGDLTAMATYLKALPPMPASVFVGDRNPAIGSASMTAGAKLYGTHCAACHGDQGEGAPGAYPALAGNRAVTMASPANLVHIVVEGGFPPSTAGNPRPFGMPPFATVLSKEDLSDLLTYVRNAWGNQATAVSPIEVDRFRSRQ